MRTPHKLAAVLFADITGYTTMMASNEALALEKLSVFKSTIKKAVLTHSGKVVQYFGDGCLITFDSSVLAVECAVSIQEALGKGTLVPVRIGIHIGDVVFKEGNVFGDAVNIASRIESIGQPGTILVSSSIRSHVRSSSEYEFKTLGNFDFKNIQEPVEVYALSNMGFAVPLRSSIEGKLKSNNGNQGIYRAYSKQMWLTFSVLFVLLIFYVLSGDGIFTFLAEKSPFQEIKEDGIIIFPFSNNTRDSTYNWLKCEIQTSLGRNFKRNEIIVKNNSTLCYPPTYLEIIKSQVGSGIQLQQLIGLKYAIQGQYFLVDEHLVFRASIFNTLNNDKIFETRDIKTPKEDPYEGIKEICKQILNFWKVKDDPFFSENPPVPGWHEEYSKAIFYFENDYDKVLKHLQRCEQIDSTEYRADFLELEAYDNLGESEKLDSLILLLEQKIDLLDEDEINLLNVHVALRNKKHPAVFKYYLNEYNKDKKNLHINTSAMAYALVLLNDHKKAVEIGEEIDWKQIDYNACEYCQDRLTIHASALIGIKKFKEALDILTYAVMLETEEVNSGNIELQIRALVRLRDYQSLDNLLFSTKYGRYSARRTYQYFLYWTAIEFALVGNKEKFDVFKNLFITEKTENITSGYLSKKGILFLLSDQFTEAQEALQLATQKVSPNNPWRFYYSALLGHALAKEGKIVEAQEIIDYLEDNKTFHPARLSYFQSLVSAGLNDLNLTLEYLNESLFQGKRYYRYEFQHDPLFIPFLKNAKFQKVIYGLKY